MQLKGRRALVTGGGQGIGRGIVTRFLAEGAQVAVAQRRPLDTELSEHPNVLGLSGDLSNVADFDGIVAAVVDEFGGLDILVNNAGVMFERSTSDITVGEWEQMVALNLRAPLFLVQAALPYLRVDGGSVINIGSIEALGSNPGHAAYSATKAGIHGLSRALAVDLGSDGIRVNTIAPGWVDSNLSESYIQSMPDPEAARRKLKELHPVGKTAQPEDIGDLAVFLASDRAGFLTGETIVADGGRTIKLSHPAD